MNDSSVPSIRRILAAPWHQRRNRDGLWVVALIVVLCASGPIALYAWSLCVDADLAGNLRHSAASTLRIALVTLMVGWWAVVVANVLEQNHPVLARLAPRHPARLRGALLALGTAMSVFAGLIFYGTADVLAVAAAAALVLAVLAASVRWPMLWVTASVVPYLVVIAVPSARLPELADLLRTQWQAQRFTLAAMLVVAAALLLAALIQDGGARHAASYESRRTRMLRFQARSRGERPTGGGTRGFFDGVLNAPYHAWLRRTLARRASTPWSRAMLGLGPGVHWTGAATAIGGTAVAVVAGIVLAKGVALVFPVVDAFVPVMLRSVAIGAMFGLVSPALQVHQRLVQTRREQALLALLPGVPRHAALNRRLGWQMTAQFFLLWLGGLALMVAFSALATRLGPPAVELSYGDARALMVIGTLPLVALQWRRWARLAPPSSMNAIGPTLLGGLIAAVAEAGQLAGWFELSSAGIAVALGALAWCALRWWRMGTEPGAFPMGRLAA